MLGSGRSGRLCSRLRGHGVSEGDQVRVETIDDMVDELASVFQLGRRDHADLPVVLISQITIAISPPARACRPSETTAISGGSVTSTRW